MGQVFIVLVILVAGLIASKDSEDYMIWTLIEKHYNVDRNNPVVLTSKNPMAGNPIDKIGEELSLSLDSMIQESFHNHISSLPPSTSIITPQDNVEKDDTTRSIDKKLEFLEDQDTLELFLEEEIF